MKKNSVVVDCPIETAINVVKGKCKINLILEVNKGVNRFGLLKKALNMSDKLLARQLSELEEDGILVKHKIDQNSLLVTYTMTDDGVRLCEIFDKIYDWGKEYRLYKEYKRTL